MKPRVACLSFAEAALFDCLGNASTCGQQPPESGICRTVRTRHRGITPGVGEAAWPLGLLAGLLGAARGSLPNSERETQGSAKRLPSGCSSDPLPENLLRVSFLVISASHKQLLPEAMHPKQASRSSREANRSRQQLEALLPTATIVKLRTEPQNQARRGSLPSPGARVVV